jgi:hypothetical protein
LISRNPLLAIFAIQEQKPPVFVTVTSPGDWPLLAIIKPD